MEIVLSILMAPIFMLTQTSAVIEILLGKDLGWSAQRRDGEVPEFAQLFHFHFWHVAVGAIIAIACAMASVYVLAWMSPIILGLVLSAPISYVTSRPPGPVVARLLATSEATAPPPIVTTVSTGQLAWSTLLRKKAVAAPGVV